MQKGRWCPRGFRGLFGRAEDYVDGWKAVGGQLAGTPLVKCRVALQIGHHQEVQIAPGMLVNFAYDPKSTIRSGAKARIRRSTVRFKRGGSFDCISAHLVTHQ